MRTKPNDDEPVEINDHSMKLTGHLKTSKFSSASRRIAVSTKTLDVEQTASQKQRALRLFCRGLIRLYLQERKNNSENGKSLGIL